MNQRPAYFSQFLQAARALQIKLPLPRKPARRPRHSEPVFGIITRYTIAEVLKAATAALVLMVLVLVLGMGVREGIKSGLPPQVIAATIPYLLPEVLGIAIPVALLFGISIAIGRMAGNNEIVAIKSLGISPMAIGWPVLTLALIVSLLTFAMYELSAGWGRPGAEQLLLRSLEQIAYNKLRTDRSFSCSRFSIAVKAVQGKRLVRPVVTIFSQGSLPNLTVMAEEATIATDYARGIIVIRFRDGQVEVAGRGRFSFQGTQEQVIAITGHDRPIHRDWLRLHEIPHFIAVMKERCTKLEKLLADSPPTAVQKKLRSQLEDCRTKLNRLRTEPFRRWANALSCFCFAVVGFATAMRFGSSNPLTSFFVCFLPILTLYYPLLMFGDQATASGLLPPVFAWTANILTLAMGLLLLRSAIVH